MQDTEVPLEHVAALFVEIAFIPLIKMEMYVRTTNKLKIHPKGLPTFKKILSMQSDRVLHNLRNYSH